MSWEKRERKDKQIYLALNTSESMFIHNGYDFEKYDIRPTHATFEDLKMALEPSKGATFINLVSNQAVLNRVKEMYQLNIPVPENKEWIRMMPGDELYTVSPVEKTTFRLYEVADGTSIPSGVRLKLIKYRLVPRN